MDTMQKNMQSAFKYCDIRYITSIHRDVSWHHHIWCYAKKAVCDKSRCQMHWFVVAPPIQYTDSWNVVNGHQQVLIKVIPLIGGDSLLQEL